MKTDHWLYHDHLKMFINLTGSKPTKNEEKFLEDYYNPYSNFAAGKELYYDSIYRLKRFYPKFIVYILIKKRLRSDFEKAGFDSLVSLHVDFSKYLLNESVKGYCKLG